MPTSPLSPQMPLKTNLSYSISLFPDDSYFVMGDNRSPGGSEDSKYFGPIPEITVAGKATAIIWPPRRNGEWNWRLLTPPEAFEEIPEAP